MGFSMGASEYTNAQRKADDYAKRMSAHAVAEFEQTSKPVATYRAGAEWVAAWGADKKGAWYFSYHAPWVESDWLELVASVT